MLNTKEKIIIASIKLFNEHGVANVRLQQIADESGISVGNLAYHFKNKDAILSTVYDRMFAEFQAILAKYLQQPSLVDYDEQLGHYYHFFKTYLFYITDLFSAEYALPEIKGQWQQLINKMIVQTRRRLDFLVKNDDLIAEPVPGAYDQLVEAIWMSILFWVPQQMMRAKPLSEGRYKFAIWNQIRPYLTKKGLAQWEQLLPPASIRG